jgi:hypothetical protein
VAQEAETDLPVRHNAAAPLGVSFYRRQRRRNGVIHNHIRVQRGFGSRRSRGIEQERAKQRQRTGEKLLSRTLPP